MARFYGVSTMAMGFASIISVGAIPAYAQDNAENETAADNGAIIVTAQKREQDILEVPVAVAAFTSEILDNAQVDEFSDLVRVSPSLSIRGDGNANQQTVAIRGIGTVSFSTSAEPTVSVVVDNVALLQPGQAFGNLADVSRVEVLRGPQGTLFGKNASAGVVNIVTAEPTGYLSGYIEGTATTDDEYRVAAMLSGPITDEMSFRLNAYGFDREGYLNNLTTGDDYGAEDGFGLRGKLIYEEDGFDVALIADYSERNSNAGAPTFLLYTPGAVPVNGAPFPRDLDGITPGPGNPNLRQDGEPVNDTEQLLLSAEFNVDVGSATLTSITSYQTWDLFFAADVDETADPTLFQFGPYSANQFAQELRLTSASGNPFEYQVGLYYADGQTDRAFTRNAPPFLGFLRQNWDSTATTESLAAFAQLGYNFSEDTKLTVGGRVNREEIGVEFADNRPGVMTVFSGDASDTAVTWRASLQHFVADDIMLFGSVATGYKGQAYDISSGFNQQRVDNPVSNEDSISYELGVKGRSANGLASFSLVGFWTDYEDFQAQGIFDPGAPVPEFALVNVGDLRTRGIEFEGTVSPADGLDIFAAAAYIDATIQEYPDASCYAGQTAAEGCVGGIQDLAGADLPNSPDFKFNVGASYETPITNDYAFFLNANYAWQDDTQYGLANSPRSIQPAYGIANVSAGFRGLDNENMELTLFVNNLFDKAYSTFIIDDSESYTAPVLTQQVPRNYSRYAGIRLRLGF